MIKYSLTIPPKYIAKVSPNDRMFYRFEDEVETMTKYFGVGMSALSIINTVALNSEKEIENILDFPCGHGRVTRFLKSAFVNAEIYGSDIDEDGLSYCKQVFNVNTFKSNLDYSLIESPSVKFDIIWVGSLLTHISEKDAIDLFKFLRNLLDKTGRIIITCHGQNFINQLLKNPHGLSGMQVENFVNNFKSNKYAFESWKEHSNEYTRNTDYGLSAVTKKGMDTILESLDISIQNYLVEGWCGHDVYILGKT